VVVVVAGVATAVEAGAAGVVAVAAVWVGEVSSFAGAKVFLTYLITNFVPSDWLRSVTLLP
jgi:hypothetical protein